MARKWLAAAVFVVGTVGVANWADAQAWSAEETETESAQVSKGSPTLAERIDGIGQSVIGRMRPAEKTTASQRPPTRATGATSPNPQIPSSPTPTRASGVVTRPSVSAMRNQASMAGSTYSSPPGYQPSNWRSTGPSMTSPATAARQPEERPIAPLRENRPVQSRPVSDMPGTSAGAAKGSMNTGGEAPVTAAAPAAEVAESGGAGVSSLHERLSAARRSVFTADTSSRPRIPPEADPEVPVVRQSAPVTPGDPEPDPPLPTLAGEPSSEQGADPAEESPMPRVRQGGSSASADQAEQPVPVSAIRSTTAGPVHAPSATASGAEQRQVFDRKSPVLSVQTVGPRRITVGKESTYELTVVNSGEVAAEDVVVYVGLPPWTEVAGADTNAGTTQAGAAGDPNQSFQWRVGELLPRSRQKLSLRIVPRESRPFDLAVKWDCKPVASQTMIEVQEPKLVLSLDGARDVLYGQKHVYKLKLVNTGTGDAENVVITLMPIGPGENQPVSQNLGLVAAGQQKAVEVELTARQVGDLLIKVAVRGDGGLRAELAEKVVVRRAALQMDVQGPAVQYVGAVATYRIRVANSGTAEAKNLKLSVNLPPGAKYVSGIDDAQVGATGSQVSWVVNSLEVGAEKSFVVKCNLARPGASRVEVISAAEGDLTASAAATTQVEAMADLRMSVKDPGGPVPCGEEATYELVIQNRGTKSAQDVEVLVYFSRGVEPMAAEGGQFQIGPGQVAFGPIPAVPAGGEVVLKVRARAEAPGNHVFRAECHCKPLGTRLLSEETTHYYLDKANESQLANGPAAERGGAPLRTADRRSLPAAQPSSNPLMLGPPPAAPAEERPAAGQPIPVPFHR